MAGHLRDLRFGQMAFALGFIELPALCEAMVELGRQNPAGGLPELLEQVGQLFLHAHAMAAAQIENAVLEFRREGRADLFGGNAEGLFISQH